MGSSRCQAQLTGGGKEGVILTVICHSDFDRGVNLRVYL